jgi:hypothetical protein
MHNRDVFLKEISHFLIWFLFYVHLCVDSKIRPIITCHKNHALSVTLIMSQGKIKIMGKRYEF